MATWLKAGLAKSPSGRNNWIWVMSGLRAAADAAMSSRRDRAPVTADWGLTRFSQHSEGPDRGALNGRSRASAHRHAEVHKARFSRSGVTMLQPGRCCQKRAR